MSIFICSGMFVFSIILEITNNLFFIKKLADKGYKYNRAEIFNINILILSFIPVINIILIFVRMFLINLDYETFVKQNVIPMTKSEKELYNNNPSIRNAIKLNKSENTLPNMALVYMENNEENIIYFVDDGDKYIITSVKGPISRLARKAQYHSLKKQLNEMNYADSFAKISQSKELDFFNNNVVCENEYIVERQKMYTKYYSE